MWGGMVGLVLQLVAGAVGGSVIGTALKHYDLGIIGNLIVGMIGGGIGAQVIGALLGEGEAGIILGPSGVELGTYIGQLASGAFGGGVLMVLAGLIKQKMDSQKLA